MPHQIPEQLSAGRRRAFPVRQELRHESFACQYSAPDSGQMSTLIRVGAANIVCGVKNAYETVEILSENLNNLMAEHPEFGLIQL